MPTTDPWTYHQPAVMFGASRRRLREPADRVPNRRSRRPKPTIKGTAPCKNENKRWQGLWRETGMKTSQSRTTRRKILRAGAGSVLVPMALASGKAPAQGGRKPFEGVTLNTLLEFDLPDAARAIHPRVYREDGHKGQLRHSRLPGLQPARRPRTVDQGQRLRRAERHLHLYQPLDRRRLADAA